MENGDILSEPLVILGMHRSGTSLVANWLHECGLFLGENLYGASEFNPHGYYEDIDFINFHKRALVEHGLHPSGHEREYIRSESLSKEEVRRMQSFLIEKSREEPWGWKDPRSCLFLDAYRTACPNARYLVVIRHYAEIVASLVRRDIAYNSTISRLCQTLGFSFIEELLIWRHGSYYLEIVNYYYECLIQHCEALGSNVIVLLIDDFLEKDRSLFHLIVKYGYPLRYVPAKTVMDAALLSKHKKVRFADKTLLDKANCSFETFKYMAI